MSARSAGSIQSPSSCGRSTDDLAPVIARVLLAGVVDFDDAAILHRADGDGAGARPEGGGEFGFRHSQRALRLDPLRDVVGHASDDGNRHTVGSKRAAKLPHASLASAGHDGQEPARDPSRLSSAMYASNLSRASGASNCGTVILRELVGRVPENASRRVVDRENPAVEVVGADQVFAVLDEVAIPVFAVSKRPLDSTAFADFRLQDGVLVEGLTLARGGSLRAPVAIA